MDKNTFFSLNNTLYDSVYGCYREECFHDLLAFERRRHERSRRSFLVMMLDFINITNLKIRHEAIQDVMNALTLHTRSTDIKGWYWGDKVLGVIMTEMIVISKETLKEKILQCLQTKTNQELLDTIRISFHQFPEDGRLIQIMDGPSCLTFYDDVIKLQRSKLNGYRMKRFVDVIGSIAAIVLFSPLFILIPIAIKLTSKGPILFRQERVGQHGERFNFLKFRSMYVNNDQYVHREFVQNFIANKPNGQDNGGKSGERVYKITKDKRITPLGHFLRRTSLDEIPQLFNVLMGDMSLVGPRPPIDYELEKYDSWHWRRVMEVKPGITGLWQVMGRSSTSFDDMVRLDLKYVTHWSLWLDFLILFKTPRAVLSGKGAY
jgi:exopolysaccharide biosynthesis polyprenyl glycosylphosphotransferase